MTTEQKITKLAQAVQQIASDLALGLRNLADPEDIRPSDKMAMEQAAERLDQLVEDLHQF